MSDTLIFARPHEPPTTPLRSPAAQPPPKRTFADALHEVEIVEAVASHQSSLLELINALLSDEPPEREKLLALRAQLRRYSSEVNVLASLLRQLKA
jgi:hypothetical protein